MGTFSIDNLNLAAETAKRILAKERIDRKLVGQSSSTPFMNIGDGNISKKAVTFEIQDRLDDKIDKHTSMMSKLTAQGNNLNKQFKPKIYQGKWRGQTRDYYGQGNDQNKYISNSGDRSMSLGVELSMDKITEEGCNMLIILEMTLGEEILGKCKSIEVKILEGDMEAIMERTSMEEVEIGLGKDNIHIISEGMIKAVLVDQDHV